MRAGDGQRHRCGARPLPNPLPACRGFTYVWVLAMVALLSLGAAALAPLWHEEARRTREDDLLRVGQLYADAIAQYYKVSPGSVKRYPSTLEDLLLDTRFVGTVRHLRALYPDPLNPQQPWGLVRASDGGVRGVFSLSEAPPLRRVPVALGDLTLPPAQRYADWLFVAKVE